MQLYDAARRATGLVLVLAVAVTSIAPARAKTTDFTAIRGLLQQGDYDAAEKRIDAVLKSEPDNVNALMYKGNVIYFRNSGVNGAGQFYGNDNESIYDDSIGSLGEGSPLTTPQAAREVAVYFKRALAIAPRRVDIQLGLCWTYANAGMKDELIARFPELRKYATKQQGLQYNMGDYARVIADNYSFEDGMAVYREIARLYPDDGNIANDMGAMYLKHRDLRTAMKYFNEAAHKKVHDADTWQNLALLYAVTGEDAKSLQAQKTLSRLNKDDTAVLYQALYDRLQGKPHWQDAVRAYARRHRGRNKKKYGAYVAFADAVLPVNGKYTPQQLATARQQDMPTQFQVLDAEWLARQFPDRADAVYDYADVLNYYHNYPRAIALYEAMERRKPPLAAEQLEAIRFHHAWALYALGRQTDAAPLWKALLSSQDFYHKSAAAYFLAYDAYHRKDYKQVVAYCGGMKADPSKSKYAGYCAELYDEAEKKR